MTLRKKHLFLFLLLGTTVPMAQGETSLSAYQSQNLQESELALGQENWSLARSKSQLVLNHAKKSSEAWILLGRAYFGEKKFRKARGAFKHALKYSPHNALAFYWKGQTFEAQEKWDEAANEYQAALKADAQLTQAQNAWTRLQEKLASKS